MVHFLAPFRPLFLFLLVSSFPGTATPFCTFFTTVYSPFPIFLLTLPPFLLSPLIFPPSQLPSAPFLPPPSLELSSQHHHLTLLPPLPFNSPPPHDRALLLSFRPGPRLASLSLLNTLHLPMIALCLSFFSFYSSFFNLLPSCSSFPSLPSHDVPYPPLPCHAILLFSPPSPP